MDEYVSLCSAVVNSRVYEHVPVDGASLFDCIPGEALSSTSCTLIYDDGPIANPKSRVGINLLLLANNISIHITTLHKEDPLHDITLTMARSNNLTNHQWVRSLVLHPSHNSSSKGLEPVW
jgi:hypothetical protein